jgi:hypothetical protein
MGSMATSGRRQFLKAGGLTLGTVAAQGCASSAASSLAAGSSGSQVAAFGWEVGNLYGNGANMYVEVLTNIILNSVNIDVSAAILAASAPGFAEVLCTAGVSRQAVPTFNNSGGHDYPNFAASASFGSVTPQNPNNLTLYFDQNLSQDQFFSAILKTWVPADGTASATSRQFLGYPALAINTGDYLVFHMDHEGVSLDAEMQIVLAYSPA